MPTKTDCHSKVGMITRGGIDITSETIVTIATDHTLYANWTTDYTIVYNLDGGSMMEITRMDIP